MSSYLVKDLFSKNIEKAPTRNGYGEGLLEAGGKNKNVVVLSADLTESTRSEAFAKKFEERFVEVGVAEQNMAALAAGMSLAGVIPFISSYATFSPGRNNEQIRTTIAINRANVKIAGAHAGVSVGPDGATHQALEDMALMRVLPNMTVISPCDEVEAKKATVAAASIVGPVYLRFARAATPVFTTDKTPFVVGRAEVFRSGTDVTIVATGPLVYEALKASHALEKSGVFIEVINCHTIKPLDEKTILASVKKTGCAVSVEEHQAAGGLGGVVAELLAKQLPVPMEFVGVQDSFGESGQPDELSAKFGLDESGIAKAVKRVLKRK